VVEEYNILTARLFLKNELIIDSYFRLRASRK